MFEKTIKLINIDNFKKIQNCKILLIGIGGVGGYTLECLVRTGFMNITIADYDRIDISNLNRQIIATQENIGEFKTEIAKKRVESINPDCKINIITQKITPENLNNLLDNIDFLIDACDDVNLKISLIKNAIDRNIPVISCLGTGNKTHPELLKIGKLKETQNDPLAKKIRNLLRKQNEKYLKIPVVWSTELPQKTNELGTIPSVPMSAGSMLASYAINKILEEKKQND